MAVQHWISKRDLRQTQWQTVDTALQDGMVRLSLDAFALTSNNATYAAFGDGALQYWGFFPASDKNFGRVPVWGFATVSQSNLPEVQVGQRVYGYFPISTTLDVSPKAVDRFKFVDNSAHRAPMSAIYNTYYFTETDPAYSKDYEHEALLFRPLYTTGWMIADCLAQSDQNIDCVIVSSASSKTALASAHALKAKGTRTIGLTSRRNMAFVEQTGLYSNVVEYGSVDTIKPSGSAAFIDFAGRPELTQAVHAASAPHLVRSLQIGMTDWEADRTPPPSLAGPKPEFFFVPKYATERAADLPPGELMKALLKDLIAFYPISRSLLDVTCVLGQTAIEAAWQQTLDGNVPPQSGLICMLNEKAA